LEAFNPKALVFLDDIQAAEREKMEKKGMAVDLGKPNPFSLFASSKEMEPFKFALYVGDSMEDMIMIKEAKRLDSRFLFAGVYDYSNYKEDMLHSFLKAGSEIVLPSVNELPIVLKVLKERGTI